MIKTCIIGASGYAGAELSALVHRHSQFELAALYVSTNSADAGKSLGTIHPQFFNTIDLPLLPIDEDNLSALSESFDLIFLATPHEASHKWMNELCGKKAVIMDLSGAFRIKDKHKFAEYYGFEHHADKLLADAVYGLADWHQEQISNANLVAVPGCYPTASLTALKPLQQNALIDSTHFPIINAVSGVSGAGRKASLNSSFTEVSLQAYGVLGHRHQPEIADYLGTDVIFTPHLGNFKRGILATITVKTAANVSEQQITDAFQQAYQGNPIVRLRNSWPKIDDVAGTPYCDLFWKLDPKTGYLVVVSAIDNLLKGAASQAIQCANLRFGFESHMGLVN
ncbi:N-acetyl-gamma-glutamyl-phosphate reductase [Paraglaciecola arctica]|uniref:N-acetyl-gamma-glutamyl-phosphate reductase n=1 Tax=Paraglaciecola arctica BSs20135 TaxID=493475 RepID=K6XN74_9ALTE|nr:N-acetyl-gamma-glutamyl-phosphate reductase [Paraglaciecola arctica]GAC22114.1 N-acetyl-gamma-glutamyl-phosphate [Paraglaciecola arctica BSs20135]